MRCRRLRLACPCGQVARRFNAIGFSPDGHLVISWRCCACKRHIHFVKPLSDCLRHCPTDADPLLEALEVIRGIESEDAKFLHSLGVRFPDDTDKES
jgi:hypothetical protein